MCTPLSGESAADHFIIKSYLMTANLHLLDVVLCFCKSHLVQHTQFNCNLISKYNLCLKFADLLIINLFYYWHQHLLNLFNLQSLFFKAFYLYPISYFLLHLFIGLIYWIYFTVSFNCSSYTESHSFFFFFSLFFVPFINSYFLVLSHFFLLHIFIYFILIFKTHRDFLLSLSFNFFESVFISWCCFISYFLLPFFFLLHLFIELILFHYSSQTLLGLFLMFPDSLFPDVSHCCRIMWPYLSDVWRFCHRVWPYIKEKVCEELTKF